MAIPSVTCGPDQNLSSPGLPHTINLTASATGTPTAWEWTMLSVPPGSSANSGTNGDFTNGISSSQNPQFNTDVAGDYVLQARAMNVEGWSLPSVDQESAQTIISVATASGNRIPGAFTYDASWGTKLVSTLHDVDSRAASSPLSAKGDLYTYDTGNQRLGVGSDGQILTANSTEATGLEWIDLPASGFNREQEFTADSANFTAGRETFLLAATLAVNANTPSGYSVRVYVNGLKQRHNAGTPGTREFKVETTTTITVGDLNDGDEIEIVYGAEL
jgi:hypothetical protein